MSTATEILKVDQTITVGDPKRVGNCVSACVATYLGRPLNQVPHFLEQGAYIAGCEALTEDKVGWWAMLVGYMAGHGLWPVLLDSVYDAELDEAVFVAGPSPRGVAHQVLYRNGALWHDPHPSRDGVLDITEVLTWRPTRHDHQPTGGTA